MTIQVRRVPLIALLSAVWMMPVVSLSAARSESSVRPCFRFPSALHVDARGAEAAVSYLVALSSDARYSTYVDHLCSPENARMVERFGANGSIDVDGNPDDWRDIPAAVVDPEGNVAAPGGKSLPAANMDLITVRAVLTKKELIVLYETAALPSRDIAYWVHLEPPGNGPGRKAYAVVLRDQSVSLLTYVDGKYVGAKPLSGALATGRVGRAVELRISRGAIPELPDSLEAFAAAYDDRRKIGNWTARYKLRLVEHQASSAAAYILARWFALPKTPTGPLPLMASLSESFAFERVGPDTEAVGPLRERVIRDGLAMMRDVEQTRPGYASLPPHALAALVNRGMNWGGYASWVYMTKEGRLTREAYEFMFLNPAVLDDVRGEMRPGGRLEGLTNNSLKTLYYLAARQKYRWKPEEMKTWPGMQEIYRQTLEDIRAGHHKLTTVNGQTVLFYGVLSANFQWKFFKEHGFFYGPCGDLANMVELVLRARGVPTMGLYYLIEGGGHTFLAYYDEPKQGWVVLNDALTSSYRDRPANGRLMLQFSLPPISPRLVYTKRLLRAWPTEVWENDRTPADGTNIGEARRLMANFHSAERMEALLRAPFPALAGVRVRASAGRQLGAGMPPQLSAPGRPFSRGAGGRR